MRLRVSNSVQLLTISVVEQYGSAIARHRKWHQSYSNTGSAEAPMSGPDRLSDLRHAMPCCGRATRATGLMRASWPTCQPLTQATPT